MDPETPIDTMTIPKGTILYHTGSYNTNTNNKYMYCSHNYLFESKKKKYKVILERDLKLKFAINRIKVGEWVRSRSSIPGIFGDINTTDKIHITYNYYNNIKLYKMLHKDYDGFVTSLEDKVAIEFCLYDFENKVTIEEYHKDEVVSYFLDDDKVRKIKLDFDVYKFLGRDKYGLDFLKEKDYIDLELLGKILYNNI